MLRIEHLSKTYKNMKKAVDDVSLHVMPGDIFGFIGPNGAGKTTTIKCVTGILRFESGDIYIDGHSVKDEPVACKQVTAYIPDNPDLYTNLTGIGYLNFVSDIYGVAADERTALIKRYGEMLDIYKDLGDVISGYSHGMRQKLAIVSALIHSPRLLILDEPFVGLDPVASHNLKEALKELCAGGSAVFFSTHVLEVAQNLCSKVAIIKNGRILEQGATDSIVKNSSLEEIFLELVEDEK